MVPWLRKGSTVILIYSNLVYYFKFSQITNTLAERYSGTKDLIFARIDGSNDDIEGLIITAYPTVLLYNKNDDIPVLYEGDYSLNDVRKFLNTHTT